MLKRRRAGFGAVDGTTGKRLFAGGLAEDLEHAWLGIRGGGEDELDVLGRIARGSGLDRYGGDASGKTIVDFNKAYNPPCAFTPFATCPLPPPQNRLPIRIEAGELKYRGGHA